MQEESSFGRRQMKTWYQVWMAWPGSPMWVASYDGKEGKNEALARVAELLAHGYHAWMETK
jgi:hypothetical protein